MEGKCRGANERGLKPRAAFHLAPGHKTAGADDVASSTRGCHHRIEHGCVEIIVSRKNQDEGCRACREACHYRGMCTAAAIANELNREAGINLRIVTYRGKRVVVGQIVADQHPRWRLQFAYERTERGEDVRAFIVDWDDDVKFDEIVPLAVKNWCS